MRPQKIELDLIENGKDSLRHAVDHFTNDSRPTDLKYAVLHVCHAVELFLKAALNDAHPALIFQKPEDATKPSAKTVDFGTLLGRLHAVGVELSDDDRKTLHALRNERNKIEHHKVELDKKQADEWIGRAMRFLNEFVKNELGLEFKTVLDAKTFVTLRETIYTYEERLETARESLPQFGPDEYDDDQVVSCPKCLQETIPFPDPEFDDGKVRCRFCDEEFFATECRSCGDTMLMDEPLTVENDPGRCSNCWEHLFANG